MFKSIFICLMLLLFINLQADEPDLPHISVTGTAIIEVVPDQMIWYININTSGLSLEEVADEHTQNVNQVLRFLKTNRVKQDSIQTSRMQFNEKWEYKNNTRVKEGYFASTDITFSVENTDLYQTLWLGLSKLANVSVRNVSYDHTKRISYQNKAREKALIAAKTKAKEMTAVLDVALGEPLIIKEDLQESEYYSKGYFSNTLQYSAVTGTDKPEGLALGTIPVRIKVFVTFRLITDVK